MLFRLSPELFWNLIASKYAASPIEDMAAYETKIKALKSYLASDNTVLDIGCGTGTQCMDLARDVKQVTGIDISRKLLSIAEQRKAERKLNNVEFIKTSLFDERLQAVSFDVVMAFYVLHFFEDIDAVFRRTHELLKPGGMFISETPCMGDKDKISRMFIRVISRLGFLPKVNLFTSQKLENALQTAGFSLVDKIKFSEVKDECTLIARKN